MSWWGFPLWGAFGGFLGVAVDFLRVVSVSGRMPWARTRGKPVVEPGAYATAVLVRLVIGGGLAWAGSSTGWVSNALLAVAVGIGAPLLAGRLADLAERLLAKDVGGSAG